MRKCFYLVVLLLVIFDASLRALEKEIPELRIVCDKIEKEEIISAYESYTFEINNYSQYSIAQPQWSYSLFFKEGGENVIATSSGATFTIPIVEDRNRYNISANNTINSTDYAWVYLRVENEYGKDEVIITLERWEDGTGIISHPVDKFTFDLNNASSIMVYSKTGKYLMRTRDTNDLKKLSQDIYILRLCDEKGICYKTIKYVSRT